MNKFFTIFLFYIPIAFQSYSQSVGINTTTPTDALHIVSSATANPLRVQVGTATKLRVLNNGGTSIGVNNTSGTPANGLYVEGNTGLGIGNPTDKLAVNGNINIIGMLKANGIAGQAGQVLQAKADGNMSWASLAVSGEETNGNGSWGDCNMSGVEAYQPVSNPFSAVNSIRFGDVVKIKGNRAIVGIPMLTNTVSHQGGAVVYEFNETTKTWEQLGNVLFDPFPQNARFGASVDIDGDYVIIGEPSYGNTFGLQGTACVFKINTTTNTWDLQTRLYNKSPATEDFFGTAVAIDGNFAIVGTPKDDETATDQGTVSIFKRNTTTGTWEMQGNKITNTSPQAEDHFGQAVDIQGLNAVVGAPGDDQTYTDEGSASFLQGYLNDPQWVKLGSKMVNTVPQAGAGFGNAVSITGSYAVVAASLDNSGSIDDVGSIHIYKKELTSYVLDVPKIWPRLTGNDTYFGYSVDISGDYLIVGHNELHINNGSDASSLGTGRALIYKKYGTIWRLVQITLDPQGRLDDNFGQSVSIDGNSKRFIVGAPAHQDVGVAIFGKVK